MTLVKSHTCSNCGGALIVHEELQQYECPYCNIMFDYTYFRTRDVLDQAGSAILHREYEAAEKRYDFILGKEPHNASALNGKILCAAGLSCDFSSKAIDDMSCSPKTMTNKAITFAQEHALEEDAPYFQKMPHVFEVAGELKTILEKKEVIQKDEQRHTKTLLSMGVTNSTEPTMMETFWEALWTPRYKTGTEGKILTDIFAFLLAASIVLIYFLGWIAILIAAGIIVCYVVVKALEARSETKKYESYREKTELCRQQLASIEAEEKEKREELEKEIRSLNKLRPKDMTTIDNIVLKTDERKDEKQPRRRASSFKKQAAPVAPKQEVPSKNEESSSNVSASVHQILDNSPKCAECGAELIYNLDREIYECVYCGVSFDLDYLRDERAVPEAEDALLQGNFHEADTLFVHALKIEPGNFRALRGRIFCAMKWTKVASIPVLYSPDQPDPMKAKNCINEALEVVSGNEKAYIEKISEILSSYEKQKENIEKRAPYLDQVKKLKQQAIRAANQDEEERAEKEAIRGALSDNDGIFSHAIDMLMSNEEKEAREARNAMTMGKRESIIDLKIADTQKQADKFTKENSILKSEVHKMIRELEAMEKEGMNQG
ncbi:MAG: hypothetical protein IKG93_02605 [Clostridiales bacterium]|nr:hypothetical protein [Clostridiales bacterium]